MKKGNILAVLMLCVSICAIAPSAIASGPIASGSMGDNITWVLDAEGILTISGTGEMPDSRLDGEGQGKRYTNAPWRDYRNQIKEIEIRSGVTSIGKYAFAGCKNLVEVSLPPKLMRIGAWAFSYCDGLTNINIPDGVTTIEEYTFFLCNNLGSIQLSDTIVRIGDSAFFGCEQLTDIKYPAGLTCIDRAAFSESGLIKVSIPKNVNMIGEDAFNSCTNLTDIEILGPITAIGAQTFYGCKNLVTVSLPESITQIGTLAFGDCSCLTNVNFPIELTIIGGSTFYNCEKLVSVDFPMKLKTIGEDAFYGCDSLAQVDIPASVKDIGDGAFSACNNLTTFHVSSENTKFYVADNALCYKNSKKLLCYPAGRKEEDYTVSKAIIASKAFAGCKNLRHVKILYWCSIGSCAFEDCSGLEKIEMPDNIGDIPGKSDVIAWGAFRNCFLLNEIKIPTGIKTIGSSAFIHCSSLTYITLPDTLTEILSQAFGKCDNLTDIYYNSTQKNWDSISISYENDSIESSTIHFCNPSAVSQGNGTSGSISKLYIQNIYDSDIVLNTDGAMNSTIAASFNKSITKGDGRIRICSALTHQFVSAFHVGHPCVSINGNILRIDLSEIDLYGGNNYYVEIDSGALCGTDGTPFYGLNDETVWSFSVARELSGDNVTMKYAQKGWPFKKNDYSKPAIPNGTEKQYVDLLIKWANNYGISLSLNKAQALLSEPVTIPISDTHGSTLLLNDNATTVRQVIEDIVFIENLKPFIEDIDKELAAIERYSGGTSFQITTSPLFQEAKIYNEMISWYGQIDEYMTGRKSGSNFVYSVAAPASHIALTKLIKTASGDSYQFIKPFLTAKLESLGNEAALRSLEAADDFNSFKNGVSDLQNALDTGKTVYTAITADGIGRIKLGTELLTKYFVEHSDNELVKEISSAYGQVKTMQSAVQLSMTVGCSLGAFPLVADLQQKLTKQLNDNVKAFYLIGDYYIADRYPNYYNAIYKTETYFPTYDLWNLIGSAATDLENQNSDPLLYNWDHFAQTEVESVESYRASVQLRQQLANYALLLRYVKSVNTESAIQGLIQYVSAISTETPTSTLYAKCPIRVNIYDNNSEELVASLSSEDGSIQDFEYGTLYLMGEDNDAKCFVLNSAEYRAEIVPYDAGTMDVLVVNDNGSGDVATTYFENVELNTNTVYELSSLLDDSLKRSEDQPVSATEAIPATGITLNGADELPIGASITYEAQVIPLVATDTTVIWNSSDERILTVDESGTANALASGEITLTATLENGIEVSKQVLIYTPATSCNIEETSVNMMVGEVFSPSITISGSSPHKVTWISSDPAVASVDENGQIHALSTGDATLKAEIDGLSTEISVSVHANQLAVSLYQSDTQGQRLKVDLVNTSCASDFEGLVYVSIYKNGQMVFLQNLPANIPAGDTTTLFIPLDGYSTQDEYTAITLIMDTDYVPHQEKVQMKILN